MSLIWEGTPSQAQSRSDEIELAMEREDRRAMIDPVWETPLGEDPVETPAGRNFANWLADVEDHEARAREIHKDDYDMTWEELNQCL